MPRKTASHKRKRGGASAPCPVCGSASEVLVTRREDKGVARWRKCKNRRCNHRFTTSEVVGPVTVAAGGRR